MELNFRVEEGTVFCESEEAPVSGSRHVTKLVFSFSEEWNGLYKTAVLDHATLPYPYLIPMIDNAVAASSLPPLTPGEWTVGVIGSAAQPVPLAELPEPGGMEPEEYLLAVFGESAGLLRTTHLSSFWVLPGALREGEISPDGFDAMVGAVVSAKATMEECKEESAAAREVLEAANERMGEWAEGFQTDLETWSDDFQTDARARDAAFAESMDAWGNDFQSDMTAWGNGTKAELTKQGETLLKDAREAVAATENLLSKGIVTEVLHGYSINGSGAIIEREGFKVVFVKKPAYPWAVITVPTIDGEYTFGTGVRAPQAVYYTDGEGAAKEYLGFCSKQHVTPETNNAKQSIATNRNNTPAKDAAWIGIAYREETEFWAKIYSPYMVLTNQSVVPNSITENGEWTETGPNFISETMPINGDFSTVRDSIAKTTAVASNFFPVHDGETLYFGSARSDSYGRLHIYDENLVYLGELTIPEPRRTKNIALTLDLTDYPTAAWAISTVAPGGTYNPDMWVSTKNLDRQRNKSVVSVKKELADIPVYRDEIKTWLTGKRITVMGDSLSARGSGAFWRDYLALDTSNNTFNRSEYANRFQAVIQQYSAIGGTCVSGNGNAMWMDSRVNALDLNADVVIIFAGTNDANNNVSLGGDSWSVDNYNTNTFYGAYNVMMSKLEYKYRKLSAGYYASQGIDYSGVTQVDTPNHNIRFLLVTPPYMGGKNPRIIEYGDAVVNLGKGLRYPVADLRQDGVNDFNAPEEYYWNGSSVHLNQRAHKRWAETIAHKLLEVEEIELSDITG